MNEIGCADCGGLAEGGICLKACKSCMLVKYCNANCQRNHWPKHKKECKLRAAEIRDEALFKDPPPKKDCQICFLPMPVRLVSCISLPPATIVSVPIRDYALAHRHRLAVQATAQYYTCCGKNICGGCVYSFSKSGNIGKCPFCKTDRMGKTNEEKIEELMKRVEANDAGAIYVLGSYYYHGQIGLQRDLKKAMDLWTQAAELGSSQAHFSLGNEYRQRGDSKKATFHYETAAMAGHEVARYLLGTIEEAFGNMERAVKHWIIASSAGSHHALWHLQQVFEKGLVSRDAMDSILTAYNNSCVEMRSEARDKRISYELTHIENRV